MAASTFDISDITVGAPVVSAKGAKTVPLSYNGNPITWLPDTQIVAYQPSAFQNEEATRVNLVMRASPSAIEALSSLDEYMIDVGVSQSERFFGKVLTRDEVIMRYNPCLKKSDKGYEPTFKAKINLSGRGKLKCWSMDKTQREVPEAWCGCSVQPRITVRSIWVMPKEFGCMFECSDILIDEAGPECPF